MDDKSKETLLAIEQNSDIFPCLQIGGGSYDGGAFNSTDSSDYDKLGTAIGNNEHLEYLRIFNLYHNITLSTSNKKFFDGIRRNSSIIDLLLSTNRNLAIADVAHEVLNIFREKNTLETLLIDDMPLNRLVLIDTLSSCTNLREITLVQMGITDEQLLPMVEAFRGYTSIEKLDLRKNRIGHAGCEALSSLVTDNNPNLRLLGLSNNDINNEGMISIANSLSIIVYG